MYIEFFGKKQARKDVPKMCRRINQRFLNRTQSLFLVFLIFGLTSIVTQRYSSPTPAVRSLFRRRAGRGAPAKAFLLFWASATLAPLEKRQQIYDRITLRIIHNTCFESSWGSGFRSLPYGKLHAIALRTVQLLFLSRSPQAFFRTLPEL